MFCDWKVRLFVWYIEWPFFNILFRLIQHRKLDWEEMYVYQRSDKWKGWGKGTKVYNVNNSIILIRVLFILTPSSVGNAYKHVRGICCCYLQGGSEWCVLWSVYVGMPCSIQGLLAAHWPHVALPTWPCADIPARVFCLPTILGKEGFCNPTFIFLCSLLGDDGRGCGKKS